MGFVFFLAVQHPEDRSLSGRGNSWGLNVILAFHNADIKDERLTLTWRLRRRDGEHNNGIAV